jgi:nuclear GTP-binding protein
LEQLRIETAKKEENFNAKSLLIKKRNIPASLLQDPVKQNRVRLLDIETYEATFGPKSRRKRTKLDLNNLEEMAQKVEERQNTYEP